MGDDVSEIHTHFGLPSYRPSEPLLGSPIILAGGCEISFTWLRPTIFREHRHRRLQIVISGEDARIETRWRMRDGRRGHANLDGSHVWFVPGGMWHGADWHRAAGIIAIQVGTEAERKFLPEPLTNPTVAPLDDYSTAVPLIGELCANIWEECRLPGPADRLTAGGMAQALAGHVLRAHRSSRDRGDPQQWRMMRGHIAKVREHIETHLDEDLSLNALAAVAGLSPSYFGQVFRAAIGLPPAAYVMGARVRRARELLRTGKHSATEVAHIAGFSSQQVMTTSFRRLLGTLPSVYLLDGERKHVGFASARKRVKWRFC
jgi:AraC family transcriptional regulator